MFASKQKFQQFFAITLFPVVIFAATVRASASEQAVNVNSMSYDQLNHEFWYSLAGTTGNCSVGAVVSFSAAIGEQIPGLSALIKASASGVKTPDNRVIETRKQVENSWVESATFWLGGIASVVIEGVEDLRDYASDSNTMNGAVEEHQAGDSMAYGFSGTYEVGKVLYGENSVCRAFATRFSEAAFERYERYKNIEYRLAVEKRVAAQQAAIAQQRRGVIVRQEGAVTAPVSAAAPPVSPLEQQAPPPEEVAPIDDSAPPSPPIIDPLEQDPEPVQEQAQEPEPSSAQ